MAPAPARLQTPRIVLKPDARPEPVEAARPLDVLDEAMRSAPLALADRVADVPLIDHATPSRLAGALSVVPIGLGVLLCALLAANPFALWLGLIACVLAAFVLLGWGMSGHWYGILVGRSNTLSLSITQSLLWTSLVLPALVAAFVSRLRTNPTNALDIGFDAQLALLMGIPVAGLAGARLISSGKARNQRPVRDEANHNAAYVMSHLDAFWSDYRQHHERATGHALPQGIPAATRLALPGALRSGASAPEDPRTALAGPATAPAFGAWLKAYLAQSRCGLLVRNLSPREASLRDLVEGDEVGDEGATDFGKAQFLLVTILALAAYAGALAWMFTHLPAGCGGAGAGTAGTPCVTSLPALSGALPSVLLTSLVGYLGFKAAPSTATT